MVRTVGLPTCQACHGMDYRGTALSGTHGLANSLEQLEHETPEFVCEENHMGVARGGDRGP